MYGYCLGKRKRKNAREIIMTPKELAEKLVNLVEQRIEEKQIERNDKREMQFNVIDCMAELRINKKMMIIILPHLKKLEKEKK